MSDWGYEGFTVDAGLASDYGSVKTSTTLRVTFAEPASDSDLVEAHHHAMLMVQDLVEAEHKQKLERRKAETTKAVPAGSQPSGPSAQTQAQAAAQVQQHTGAEHVGGPAPEQPATDPPVLLGQKPEGRGTFPFPATWALDEDGLQQRVREEIAAIGYNPDHFYVYDERVGPNGLEQGGSAWTFASVRAAGDGPWEQHLGRRAAFYVSLNDQHKLQVEPSKHLKEAQK